MSSVINARQELLGRLENADWECDRLIDAVSEGVDYDKEYVVDALEHLKKTGEVYVVNGEVRKT